MSSLSPTARVILGMLKLGARTGYELKKTIDISTRFFWGASFGQIYPELKRLRKEGLVKAKSEPRGRIKRTEYELTRKGEAALLGWLTDVDNAMYDIRDEGLLRLFFGDVVPPADALANVRARREFFEQALAHFREIEQEARVTDFPYLALRYGIGLMEWSRDWYADVERRLEAGQPLIRRTASASSPE
jgi:PadR family transcriptional regulator, regulatory protein AphA